MTPSLDGAEKCPHCGASARIERSPSLRWRCAVCGGGRVPGLPAAALKPASVAKLVDARRGRAIDVMAGVGALVFLVTTLTLVALAAFAFGHGVGIAGGLLAGMGALGAVATLVLRRVHARNATAWRIALDDAWTDAAEQIAQTHEGVLTTAYLAGQMQISEADADSLLSQLSLEGARVSVGEDALLRYRIDPKIEDMPVEIIDVTEKKERR